MNIELTNSQLHEQEILKHKFKDGESPISIKQALRYEVASSWLTNTFVLPKQMLDILSLYYRWKVDRKFARYLKHSEYHRVIVQQQSPTNDPDTSVA